MFMKIHTYGKKFSEKGLYLHVKCLNFVLWYICTLTLKMCYFISRNKEGEKNPRKIMIFLIPGTCFMNE